MNNTLYWQQQNKTLPIEKTEENLKLCWICGRGFHSKKSVSRHCTDTHKMDPKKYYDKFYKLINEEKCKICGKDSKYMFGKYAEHCSYKCSNNNTKLNEIRGKAIKQSWKTVDKQQRWEKTQKTWQKNYGTNIIFNLPTIKAKRENTWEMKYGTKDIYQTKKYLQLLKTGVQDKYGVDNISQLDTIKEKKKITTNLKTFKNFERFSKIVIPLFDPQTYQGNNQKDLYKWKCIQCNGDFEDWYDNGIIPRCPKCFPITRSKIEDDLALFLTKTGVLFERNDRTLLDNKHELDFLMSKDIAIEFDGLYWHSEITGKKDKNYHLNKTIECENKNIQLVHIFEDEWYNHKQIIQRRLLNLLGLLKYKIFARKCVIKLINPQLKNKFLNKYHIQGEDKSAFNLGLFYKNRLVAVMTFSKLRKALGNTHKEGSWELSRYVTIGKFNVVGGASKLLTYFERNYNPKKIITYADRRWSKGNLYYKLGFKLDHISPPNYWYIHNHYKRLYRFNFRKNVLKDKLEIFDPNLTEWENMQINGYDRIWDCGNYVFTKEYIK